MEVLKTNHLEVSDGETIIVAYSKCPLTKEEARKLNILAQVDDTLVPCCRCTAILEDAYDFICPNFNSAVKAQDFHFEVNCEYLKNLENVNNSCK